MSFRVARTLLAGSLAVLGAIGLGCAVRADAPKALQVTYQVRFTGKLSVAGTVMREADYKTCLDFALDKEKGALALTAKVGGHSFDFALPDTPIHGPGTYTAERVGTNWLIFDGSQELYNFNSGAHGTATVTINANGSGSATLAGW